MAKKNWQARHSVCPSCKCPRNKPVKYVYRDDGSLDVEATLIETYKDRHPRKRAAAGGSPTSAQAAQQKSFIKTVKQAMEDYGNLISASSTPEKGFSDHELEAILQHQGAQATRTLANGKRKDVSLAGSQTCARDMLEEIGVVRDSGYVRPVLWGGKKVNGIVWEAVPTSQFKQAPWDRHETHRALPPIFDGHKGFSKVKP